MFNATIVMLSLQGAEQSRCNGYWETNSYYCSDGCGVGCNETGGSGQGEGVFVCNGDMDD